MSVSEVIKGKKNLRAKQQREAKKALAKIAARTIATKEFDRADIGSFGACIRQQFGGYEGIAVSLKETFIDGSPATKLGVLRIIAQLEETQADLQMEERKNVAEASLEDLKDELAGYLEDPGVVAAMLKVNAAPLKMIEVIARDVEHKPVAATSQGRTEQATGAGQEAGREPGQGETCSGNPEADCETEL